MAEPSGPDSVAAPARCPWCSAELASRTAANCSSCGAVLTGEPDTALPGVTAVDAEAIVRAARVATPVRRNRLLSWISGDDSPEDDTPAEPGSLAPPPPDVRREMLRLALEAEVANLQAEADSFVSIQPAPSPVTTPQPEPSVETAVAVAAGEAAQEPVAESKPA
ncbi:MAG: hypothetical protein ACJ77B_09545 [Chloroflexota bacterium]